jgi:hypothetical protein
LAKAGVLPGGRIAVLGATPDLHHGLQQNKRLIRHEG